MSNYKYVADPFLKIEYFKRLQPAEVELVQVLSDMFGGFDEFVGWTVRTNGYEIDLEVEKARNMLLSTYATGKTAKDNYETFRKFVLANSKVTEDRFEESFAKKEDKQMATLSMLVFTGIMPRAYNTLMECGMKEKLRVIKK